jgi:dTMP kinase
MRKGRFIAFEGGDGCGKGTQMQIAAEYVFKLNKEYDILLTREPTRDFKEIRKRMAQGNDVRKDSRWYAKMFVADRKNHCENYIKPNLERGTDVFCDRFKHSTLAYQHTQGMDLKELIKMHEGILVPDTTLIFDCPAEVAYERRKNDGAIDVFDKDLKFQQELRLNYLRLRNELPDERIIIIDATKSIEEVATVVKAELDMMYFADLTPKEEH